jgi:hypothetical protein
MGQQQTRRLLALKIVMVEAAQPDRLNSLIQCGFPGDPVQIG